MPPERSGAHSDKAATVPSLGTSASDCLVTVYAGVNGSLDARSCRIDTMRLSNGVSIRNTVPSCGADYAMPFRAMKLSGDASSTVTSQPR